MVTGSSGKLGTAVVKRLRHLGYKVIGIDLIAGSTTNKQLDIRDKNLISKLPNGFDAIIHTAAIHGMHYDLDYSRESFIETNIYGTLNLLEGCLVKNIKKFLYISSTSIYGNAMVDPHQAVWVDEQLSVQPRDIYDISKQTAEQLCKDYFFKEGLQTSVYIVGRFLNEEENLKTNHRLYRGLDERDAAEALHLALTYTFDNFEIFNIASSSSFRKTDLIQLKNNPIEIILDLYPKAESIYKLNGWQFPKSIDRVYVIDKAKKILGFEPKYTFEYLLNHSF